MTEIHGDLIQNDAVVSAFAARQASVWVRGLDATNRDYLASQCGTHLVWDGLLCGLVSIHL